jgi:hypothetical protein
LYCKVIWLASPKTLAMHTEASATAAERGSERHRIEAASTERTAHEPDFRQPVRWRELSTVVVLVVLADVSIYRAHGFAGCAAMLFVAPTILVLGALRPQIRFAAMVVGLMIWLLAARIIWCGSFLALAAGFALLAAFGTALSGETPHVLETVRFALLAIAEGIHRLIEYGRSAAASRASRIPWLNLAMPIVAVVLFGTVFIFANPDLLASVRELANEIGDILREWLRMLSVSEMVFWVAAACISAGLLQQSSAPLIDDTPADVELLDASQIGPSKLYAALRNTLAAVISLFAVYLVFEFRTLWFREFPKGFYYSGYAHEGAAWLTFALALATLVLSLVFRGGVLADPRLPRLRRLAWIWSAENFILAVAVYHRLAIYVGFNGMSPMRIVGWYGISAVVVGFALVLWKIGHGRRLGWLLRRQLWTLALAVYMFLLTPVDAIVVKYNVGRILAGDPAPSVQISVHPISNDGVLLLLPLLETDDATIREGVRAMLAQREDDAEAAAERRESLGWTSYQISEGVVLERLRAERHRLTDYRERLRRDAALKRFHEYAYQWY